nr:recombinase family protein [Burkholderia sp. BCC0405]
MRIGYARVSTDEQHLDLQLEALTRHNCDLIFQDQGISGASVDRPGLQEALRALKAGDAFVVWRVDRLSRSLLDLVNRVNELSANNIQFVSLMEHIDTTSPTGRFSFHMIAALAEFERALIAERTRAGLAVAKQRGRTLGRPAALTTIQLVQARELLQTESLSTVAHLFHVSSTTLRRHLRRHEAAQSEGESFDEVDNLTRDTEI